MLGCGPIYTYDIGLSVGQQFWFDSALQRHVLHKDTFLLR